MKFYPYSKKKEKKKGGGQPYKMGGRGVHFEVVLAQVLDVLSMLKVGLQKVSIH